MALETLKLLIVFFSPNFSKKGEEQRSLPPASSFARVNATWGLKPSNFRFLQILNIFGLMLLADVPIEGHFLFFYYLKLGQVCKTEIEVGIRAKL